MKEAMEAEAEEARKAKEAAAAGPAAEGAPASAPGEAGSSNTDSTSTKARAEGMEVHEDRPFVCDCCICKFTKRDIKQKEVNVVTVWKPTQEPISP